MSKIDISVVVSVFAFLTLSLFIALTPPTPRLIGYGCEGASGPIYAMEEDQFPLCRAIERYEG